MPAKAPGRRADPGFGKPAASRSGRNRPVSDPLLGLVGVVAFLLAWELVPRLGLAPQKYLPPASEAFAALVRDFGLAAFWVSVGETMAAWAWAWPSRWSRPPCSAS